MQARDPDRAADCLRRALQIDPYFALAANDLGVVLAGQGRLADAGDCFRRAVRIDPDYPEAHNNLGNVCQMTGAVEESIGCYRKAVELRPDYAEAFRNLGSALRRCGQLTESLAAFETAVSLNPLFAEAIAQVVLQARQICAWDGLERLEARLIDIVEKGSASVNPFLMLCLESTPAQQLRCARRWAADHMPEPAPAPRRVPGKARITLGYLSADYQEHATAQLIGELFSLHDRNRFRVIGYSYGRDDGSAARRRLAQSLDAFVDLETASFAEAARRIREDGVDILVDLKGYTQDARPQILALRPAPVQVNYLGYPGTMGIEAVDYILVDSFVVPPSQQPFFSEKLVHLPDCYQVNDRTRRIAPRTPTRAECGLPESAFVYCCFSVSHKITPPVFEVWMRLLAAVEGSVLWLLETNPLAAANLRREAEARGVRPERLVFAPKLPNPEHLARFAVADLFLDTLPYNAHTLASDALWGGCPMVTCAGETFASRVAGSLLRTIGRPDLVTESLGEYEALALRLARQPEELRRIREEMAEQRLKSPLFDSRRFARNLEAAYEAMLAERA